MKTTKNADKEVGERFRKLRLHKGLDQKPFSDLLGITQQAVSEIERTGKISKNTIEKVTIACDVDPGWLLYGRGEDPTATKTMADVYASVPEGLVPVIAWDEILQWGMLERDALPMEGRKLLPSPNPQNKKIFALQIKTDAMVGAPKSFNIGSYIIVDPTVAGYPQDYVVIIKDGASEAMLRQYIKEGGEQRLKPLNRQYPIEDANMCAILGVVIEHRDYREEPPHDL